MHPCPYPFIYLGRNGLSVILWGGATAVVHDAAIVVGPNGGNLVRAVLLKVAAPSRCYVCPIDRHILIPVNDKLSHSHKTWYWRRSRTWHEYCTHDTERLCLRQSHVNVDSPVCPRLLMPAPEGMEHLVLHHSKTVRATPSLKVEDLFKWVIMPDWSRTWTWRKKILIYWFDISDILW